MSKTRVVSQDIGDASILPADLDVSADNTTADSTTGHHGLLQKLGGGTSNYLRADGTWNTPPGTWTVSVATDPIWDAAGDLAVGTGSDTAAKLTKGADSTVLTIDQTTHLPVWTAPSSSSHFLTIPIWNFDASTTINVNSSSYVGKASTGFYVDFDLIPWTHFSIYFWGQSNAAAQTVTFQMCDDETTAGTAISAGGNELTVTNAASTWYSSGWVAITASLTGIHRLAVQAKGSNTTVDYVTQNLGVMFKKV